MPFDEQDGEDGPSANLDMVVEYNERNVKLWFHVLEDKMRAKGVLRYGQKYHLKWLRIPLKNLRSVQFSFIC